MFYGVMVGDNIIVSVHVKRVTTTHGNELNRKNLVMNALSLSPEESCPSTFPAPPASLPRAGPAD